MPSATTAEDHIVDIENNRHHKATKVGMIKIAKRFRELEKKVTQLIIKTKQ